MDQRSILDFFPTSASPGFGSRDRHTEPPAWPCPLRTQGANDVKTPKGQHDPEDSPHAQCTLSRIPPTVTQQYVVKKLNTEILHSTIYGHHSEACTKAAKKAT